MISKAVVVGGGSAGFIAAATLKLKLPALDVRLIRSRDIGIIGVGEGSTSQLTRFLHDYLRINPRQFFEVARPTFKLGLRFIWGRRPYFNYTFGPGPHETNVPGLAKSYGFYADADMEDCELFYSLMTADRAFLQAEGRPRFHTAIAYHFENEKFVRFLEEYAIGLGVQVIDDTIVQVNQNEAGISGLVLQSGTIETANLYVDCSGFVSLLLGKTLGEPFIDFKSSLFCNRAMVGGWERTDEIIKPYTTCETMPSGWCWQIEHESRINRGYVYCSDFISDEEVEKQFRTANPKVGPTRIVRFITGRYDRRWVKNVVAIGNASGFVEPLEATALGLLALQSRHLAQTLLEVDCQPTPTQIAANNVAHAQSWDDIRRFIAIHYKYNDRLDTPFWRACREETDLAGAEPIVEYYQENGPAPYWAEMLFDRNDQFGYAGYTALLLGQQVPFRKTHAPTPAELQIWERHCARNRAAAASAMSVRQALDQIHSPNWKWESRT
jgi:tryptophan halogenase